MKSEKGKYMINMIKILKERILLEFSEDVVYTKSEIKEKIEKAIYKYVVDDQMLNG